MAKSGKRLDVPTNQLSLLDLLSKDAQERQAEPGAGSLNLHDRLKAAMSISLKQALPKSRWNIAGEMSHLLGVEVSKYQLDSWVAESKDHRLPAEYLAAFCAATGSLEPLRVLNDACKVFTVQGPDALRAEIRRDEEEIKVRQRDRRKKEALLAALEGR
jgi:hypothetical protein